MRMVYFLSAMPGTGKSTYIREHGLDAHTLSLDAIRHIYSGAATDMDGSLVLSNNKEDLVFGKFMEAFDIRLQTGSILFIDNLNQDQKAIDSYMELLNKFDYDYRVVRFPLQPVEFYYARNEQREPYKRLPKDAIDRNYVLFANSTFSEPHKIITPEDAINFVKASPEELLIDLSKYKKIHYIGDLQGSFYALKKYFEQEGGYKKDEFYIFVGDYIDRGIENDKCLHFMRKYMEYDNFIFLMGNHEKHLYNYSNDIYTPPDEFMNNTLPQLEKAGFDKDEMKRLYRKMQMFSFVKYNDKKIMTTHAGLTAVPFFPRLVSDDEYMRGYGPYSYDIDKKFNEQNIDNEWYQVHGHRNQHKLDFNSYAKSFALEADVEYGGSLPVLRVNREGLNGVYITNKIFNKEEVLRQEKEAGMFGVTEQESPLTSFLTRKVDGHKSGAELIESLRKNPMLDAISNKKIKDSSFKIRGLVINNKTGDIVVRGFDKFYELNEEGIPFNTIEALKEKNTGSLSVYEQDDGRLAIVGYDPDKSELIFSSKNGIDNQEAKDFKKLMLSHLKSSELEYMKVFANKHNVNYVFEVIDPINNPMIIKAEQANIVLLAVVKRDVVFSQLTYENLEAFTQSLEQIAVKKKFVHFGTFENFEKFYKALSNESGFKTKRHMEGFVVEGSSGMFKVKLPYYQLWKAMHDSIKVINQDAVKGVKTDTQQLVNHLKVKDEDKPLAIEFLESVKKLSSNERNLDIVTLRDRFLTSRPDLLIETKSRKNKNSPT
jgi:predicted kinase